MFITSRNYQENADFIALHFMGVIIFSANRRLHKIDKVKFELRIGQCKDHSAAECTRMWIT
jgi:hypothetical protein